MSLVSLGRMQLFEPRRLSGQLLAAIIIHKVTTCMAISIDVVLDKVTIAIIDNAKLLMIFSILG